VGLRLEQVLAAAVSHRDKALRHIQILEPRANVCARIGEADHHVERRNLPQIPADELGIIVS